MSDLQLQGAIEALLFASGQPLPADKIGGILQLPTEQIHLLIADMLKLMPAAERGLIIVEVAGGYQLCTKPVFFDIINKLADTQEARLSTAALETLSIVAFKQPVTKQEIESIRGVSSDRVLTTLSDRMLIKEIGRKEAIGRPILYGTTTEFLQCFGLNSLEDLPAIADLLPENHSAE